MAIKFNFFLRTLSTLVVATFLIHISVAQGGRREALMVGWWTPIKDLTNPKVVEIGKFAVDEHNKEAKTKLEYQKVVEGEKQTVTDVHYYRKNYRLVIAATDGGSPHNYLAEVADMPWEKSRNLTSFKEKN